MKSLLSLWFMLAEESAGRCCTSATMDCKTVQGRFEHEGMSFLTISLPNFGTDFQKSLDQGFVDRHHFAGFRRSGELPLFLGGFLDRVFDRSGGVLLDNPCIDSILAVRQLTLMFGKMLLPCSDARERRAMRGFLECEKDVRKVDAELSKPEHSLRRKQFNRISSLLFRDLFTAVDRKVYYGDIIPRHGPGGTADRLKGNQKFNNNTWTKRLEEVFPSGEYLLPNWSFYDHLDKVDILEPGSEIPVRVVSVPKTQKTPRIIAMEPTAVQYVQQGLMAAINEEIDQSFLVDFISTQSQEPNQLLAREGSLSGNLATLDLSEASDRVSNQQVRDMLVPWPHLSKAVDACRSRKADVPGYGVTRLAKFASMGSALCFPMESMVFLTMVFMGIEDELNTSLDRRTIHSYVGQVRVYGDDIIVPVEYVRSVTRVLQTFGSVVNPHKSFWNGKFRESCGRDYYDGTDVSIVRVRRNLPTSRRDVQEVISLVSLRNQLYFAGYWQTCKVIDEFLRKMLKHFPVVEPSSPALGRYSYLGYQAEKTCSHLHRPLVRAYVKADRTPFNRLDDIGALLKFLIKGGQKPLEVGHLERSGRPHAVDIMLRWTPPY